MTKVRIYKDAAGEHRWQAIAENGHIVADSGEGYVRHIDALQAAQRLFTPALVVDTERPEKAAVMRIPEVLEEGLNRLGRHVEHDPASRQFAFKATGQPLHAVSWQRDGGPFDQGDLGSCTGNAAAGLCDTAMFRNPADPLLVEADAVKIYEEATILDKIPGHYPPNDTGSSGLAAAKALKNRGLIAGYRHAFSLAAALEALQQSPVMTGVEWLSSFDTPDKNGLVQLGGSVRGGHEFEVDFFDPAQHEDEGGLVGGINSWGLSWGIGGRFFFTAKTWGWLLARHGDVTIPTPVLTHTDVPSPRPAL